MKNKKLARGAAIGGALALTAGLFAAPTTALAVGDSFDSNNAAVFIGWGTPTTLSQAVLDPSGSGFNLENISTAGVQYNALGFNTVDNYLYAIQGGDNHLLQIGTDGEPEDLGSITGLPSNPLQQGTFGLDANAGILFLYNVDASGTLYAVDVTAKTSVAIPLTGTLPNVSDFAYRDGYIWAYNGNAGDTNFYRVDLTDFDYSDASTHTATVAAFSGASLGLTGQPYGGQWFYGNGNLGLTGNNNGQVYQISIDDAASATPQFRIVTTATGQPTANNDAASIAGLPADLAIEKTGEDVFYPGEAYTYTITLTNEGVGNSSGSIVTDTLPAGLENPVADGAGCSIAAGVMTCNVGPIAAGDSRDFTVSGTAATDATDADMVNMVSVFGNEADPNPDNDAAEFGPVVADPSFTLTKTARPDPISPNDKVVEYTFVVENTGNVPLTEVTVTDPGPIGGKGTMSAIECEDVSLDIDGSFTCTATYTLSPEDFTGEPLKNEATATAKDPSGATINAAGPATASADTVLPEPALDLVKTAVGGPAKKAGQVITYKFEVTNIGNVDVENVEVAEGEFTGKGELSPVVCPAGAELLAVDDSVTCTATYKVVAADLTGKPIENTATASGDTPFGPAESNEAEAEVPTVKPASAPLATTGGQSALMAGGIALLLLAAGAGAVVAARRKRVSAE